MPPPVDPAQAPQNIRRIRIHLLKAGHRLKSAVEYPVVVMIDPTWNAASLIAIPIFEYIPWTLIVIKVIAPTIIP